MVWHRERGRVTMAESLKPNRSSAAYLATKRAQSDASDPLASVWVSANAGTGKTYVLTNRVLRLLLAATPPERILALTYTKAAAAEMSKRVFDRLGGWVTADPLVLSNELLGVLARPPTTDELALARQLFALAIETPGGLKVQTIHAFCERLLKRFPLEAGIPPGFAILDDETGDTLRRAAVDDVLKEATRFPDARLAAALNTAIAYAIDDGFDDVLRQALQKRDWLDGLSRLELGRDDATRGDDIGLIYRKAFGLSATASRAACSAAMAAILEPSVVERAVAVLSAGKTTDQTLAANLSAAKLATSSTARIAAFKTAFLTKDNEARSDKAFITKAIREAEPALTDALVRARDRFSSLLDESARIGLLDATLALVTLSDAVMQRYAEAKARRAALDFDDLIRKAGSLLGKVSTTGQANAAEWVLYKLDGGLDHILVDEAQDTSRAQWSVIERLAEEFFVGSGARDCIRTLFGVGDEKQSIYGFQGAAPKMFADMGRGFGTRAAQTGQIWRKIALTLSFRTVEPVLDAVDTVFSDPLRTPGLTADGGLIRHEAQRLGQAGLVEIWPTEKPDEATPIAPWLPLDEKPVSSPVARLAAKIADTIQGWLENNEVLRSQNRAVREGDILILVRSRRPFAPAMVAALKARGVAVAGADRLRLVEQIAVQDLIVLGDFLTLPEDDLALATILKSPFFGLDDMALLDIASDRKGTLWSALLARAKIDARFVEAADTLKAWRGAADFTPPYEFFAALLEGDDGKFRRRLLTRLGAEAADPIDEFLNLALTYDEGHPPSLQGFLTWLRATKTEIKRDMDQGRNEVRIMTVHGAKGLEAPIVFLPDTCAQGARRRQGELLVLDQPDAPAGLNGLVIWPIKGSGKLGPVAEATAALVESDTDERNRLLYVAMTRARDRLYIAGFEGKTEPPATSWYRTITGALDGRLQTVELANGTKVRRIEVGQTADHDVAQIESDTAPPALRPPDWSRNKPMREGQLSVPLAPSRLAPLDVDEAGEPIEPARDATAEPSGVSPRVLADDSRFLRGTLTHALLEHLPLLPAATWAKAAQAFLASRADALPQKVRDSIAGEVMRVLRDPAFAPVFGPNSQAEVPIVAEIARPDGRGKPFRLTGQIDRLVDSGDTVWIVDYKTNRPPPLTVDGVADAYLLQLTAYRLAVGRLFQGRTVRAAILWTDGARLMEIPANVLDAAAERLWTLSAAPHNGGSA
jgi:ATP-dependent helicase/nuclease subunit A